MQVIHNVLYVCVLTVDAGTSTTWANAPGASSVRKWPASGADLPLPSVDSRDPQDHCGPSLRTQMLRKLIGGEGSPCACSLMGASW